MEFGCGSLCRAVQARVFERRKAKGERRWLFRLRKVEMLSERQGDP
jgi:hypothetical protein